MKSIFYRKLFLIVLVILIIFKALDLSYHNSSKLLSKGSPQKIQVIEYAASSASGILQRLQFELEQGLNSNINGILVVFAAWKFILVLFFLIKLLVFDRRKRIIGLITPYFEGSKYKDAASFLQ